MASDLRDPFHQHWPAMTSWERSLRPKPESRWLLWLVVAALLVFGAWRASEWLLTYQRTPAAPSPPPAVNLPTVPPPTATRTPPDTAPRAAPPAESYSVSKCLSASGQSTYSDGPCPAGTQASTVWVQPDVNLADGMSATERDASIQDNRQAAAQTQQIEQGVPQQTRSVRGDCAAWEADIKRIDAMARQPQNAPTQDWLANEKKLARDRQFRAGCR